MFSFKRVKETLLNRHYSPFIQIFNSLEDSDEFPFRLAINSLEHLENETRNDQELLMSCLEDSIFASLTSTFYEEAFMALKRNKDKAIPLIDKFADTTDEREKLIAKQCQEHLNFVINGGVCGGCSSCENHNDVEELVLPYLEQDLDFFVNLFIGMHTIQYTLEYFLYDVFPESIELIDLMNQENIIEFRKYLYNYAEESLD
ncbi:MAG: hypothetical protein H6622_16275 [Halobacteriovoraceae bacterium]|nr:hypothetical protein [Halobacteriovoraceae bacterium]